MENYFNQMKELLLKNKELGQIAIKAEFESEGTRTGELLRLKEIAYASKLPMVVKIGGCEALRDLLECADLRIENIVAPMIESSYAASKYIEALKRVYGDSEFIPNTYINIETELGFSNMKGIVKEISKRITGVVLGRVDYVGSSGLSRKDVNSDRILEDAIKMSEVCKKNNLDFAVGGGISVDAIPFLSKLNEIKLNRFETRKCVFSATSLGSDGIKQALRNAVLFELLWLKSKQSYNYRVIEEDIIRIKMLEKRHLYNTSSCS